MKSSSKEQVEIIRAACIKANPAIETRRIEGDDEGQPMWMQDNTIHLADVLLAIGELTDAYIVVSANGVVHQKILSQFDEMCRYNLRADDLTQQSDEFLEFAAQLLTPPITV